MSWDKVLSKHRQQFRYCCVLLFWERTSWSSILLPLRGMRLSLQSIVSKKIIPILQTQHFFKVMSPWATMADLQPKAQEGLTLWIPPPKWLPGRLGHGEECLFLTVFFRFSLSDIFIFCCLAKAKSLVSHFFLPRLVFYLFWWLIEDVRLLVRVPRKHEGHFESPLISLKILHCPPNQMPLS